MSPDDDEIEKLRRFTLLVALVLFVYAIYGVELDLAGDFRPLGIPLKVTRANLLGHGLVALSTYTTLRYCLLALLLAKSPIKARRRLRHGHLATWRPFFLLFSLWSQSPRPFQQPMRLCRATTARMEPT